MGLKSIKKETVSTQAAELLLEELLQCEDGELLGFETDLSERLGISTPTLRQATKLLEYQQLLVIKRGRGGGYYARKPSTDGVANLAAIVLRANKASVFQVLNTLRMISAETTRLACNCRNEADLNALRELQVVAQENLSDSDTFLEAELKFDHLLASMPNDPVLTLFTDIALNYSKVQREVKVFRLPRRRKKFQTLRTELIDAILAGDAASAATLHQQRFELLELWLKTDLRNT
jgi:GntR family transcriptional repressor for pyruvate dehydrogenase complex